MPITKHILNFWIITVVGIVAFGWMIAELVRAVLEVGNQAGVQAVFWDGVVQHKVGELMVGVPFVAILALANLWPKERVRVWIRRTVVLMVIGGLLNVIAWYSLRDRIAATDFLRLWCLTIFAFGLIGSWLLTLMLERMNINR